MTPQNIPDPQRSNTTIRLEQGQQPPHAIDMEKAIIGAILIDTNAMTVLSEILYPECFYMEEHQLIFKCARDLFGHSKPIDILTVARHLRKLKQLEQAGGEHYLIELSNQVSSSAHAEYHARIILQKYIGRRIIETGGGMARMAFDEGNDVFDILDHAEQQLFELTHNISTSNYEKMNVLVSQMIGKVKDLDGKGGLSGVPSGFTSIDRVTGGWQASDLVIIAARPGMGKTALVLSMARYMAIDHGVPVGFFSLEMSNEQITQRLVSAETRIAAHKIRTGDLDEIEWNRLVTKVNRLEEAPIYVDDTPSLSVYDLRAKARRLVSQHKVKLIIVDYLQLMTYQVGNTKMPREQEISSISRSLKALAKELNVPVIALSQLSRAVETRGGNKRPMLSDLRESGAIEQDADIVSFVYRPEYYDITEWEDGQPSEDQAEFMISKHRAGGLENIRLTFQGAYTTFSELEASTPYDFAEDLKDHDGFPEDSDAPF